MEYVTNLLLSIPFMVAVVITVIGTMPMLGVFFVGWRPTGYKQFFVLTFYLFGAIGGLSAVFQIIGSMAAV